MIGEYSSAELCRILRLSQSRLRTCLRAALLPISRAKAPCTYTFQDLVMLRTAKGLTEAGVRVGQIRKVLEGLQHQLGTGQTMTSLTIYASEKRVVVWDGLARWQPDSGQFLLNFDRARLVPSTKLKARRPPPPALTETAQTWFDRALALEEHSEEAARSAYRKAIRLQPALADAHINLGRLYHNAGELAKAEASYREALRYEPTLAWAHFNVAVVLEDQHKNSAAIAAYEEALKHAPTLWEAHCNLAQLYETLGRKRDAIRHYAAAKRLKT
jgi:DNA-binding transcriptional MerR regulator